MYICTLYYRYFCALIQKINFFRLFFPLKSLIYIKLINSGQHLSQTKGITIMKKFMICLSVAALCTAVFSCGSKKSSEAPESSAQSLSAEKLTGVSYKKTTAKLPEEIELIYCMKPYNGSSEHFIVGYGETDVSFWAVDSDFTSFRRLPLENILDDDTYSYDLDITDSGTIICLSCDEGKGFRLRTFSLDGEALSDVYISNYPSDYEEIPFISEVSCGEDILAANIDGSYELFSMDGSYISSLALNDGDSAESIGRDSEGRLVCAVRTEDEKLRLCTITPEGKTEDKGIIYDISETIQTGITAGSGDYSMFLRSMTTIYGIRKSDSSPEALFSINSAGISSDSISGIAMGSDGNFIIAEMTFTTTTKSNVRKYIPCTPEELENIPALTVGMTWMKEEFSEMADQFNESRSDCRIEMKIYSNEDYDVLNDEITQDALSGNLPDMVVGTTLGALDLEQNEALCDLYEFMDKDDELNRQSFLPNYLEEIDRWYGGHIYNIPNTFRIILPFTAKSKFLEGIDTWDTAAYLDLIESIPEDMKPDSNLTYEDDTQNNRLYSLFVDFWMDYETLECSFDTPEFARYLEFCKKGLPNEEYTDIPSDVIIQRQKELATAFIDEKILFTEPMLLSYSEYLILRDHTFADVDFDFMGSIGSDGAPEFEAYFSTSLSITKDCSNKDAAWDYIKMFYTDDYYNSSYEGEYGFPATISGLENFRRNEKAPKEYKYDENLKDYDGVAVYTGTSDENGNAEYDRLGYVDDRIISEMDALIAEAKLPKRTIALPSGSTFEEMNDFYNEFYGIYFDETARFLNDEITAEECGYMLQNRYSIYLSENFG